MKNCDICTTNEGSQQHRTEHDLMHLSLLQVKLLYSEHCLANTKIQTSNIIFGEIFRSPTQCANNVLTLDLFLVLRFFGQHCVLCKYHPALPHGQIVTPGSCPGLFHSIHQASTSFTLISNKYYLKKKKKNTYM